MGTIFVWCIFLFIHYCEASSGDKQVRIILTKASAPKKQSQYESRDCQASNQNCASVPRRVTYYFKNQLVGTITIGTPPQPFEVLFDTGSTDFWITSSKCQMTDVGCRAHRGYNNSKSSTYKAIGEDYSMTFPERGNITGHVSMDTVGIGNVQIKNQKFVEVTRQIGPAFAFARFDGIFGLGSPSTSTSDDKLIPLKMYQQGYFSNGLFSFYIARKGKAGPAGELIFGGMDPKHFTGLMVYTHLSPTGRWQIPMANVMVDGERGRFCIHGCQAVLNTGSSFIAGPPEEIKGINQRLGAVRNNNGHYYVNCNTIKKLPVVTFGIGRNKFPLQASDYVVKVSHGRERRCMSGFVEFSFVSPEGPMWILGTTFMTRYYTVFDALHCKIGLALAV